MTQVAVGGHRRRRRLTVPPALGRALAGARSALAAPDVSPAVLVVTRVLGLLALLGLWLVLFALVLSGLVYSHAQSELYARFRSELANGVAPLGGSMSEGSPVALISARAAGLDDVVVVEGTSGQDLQDGPGHMPGTPLPGQAGASLLLGRSTSFGAPFAKITSLVAGDTIDVTTGEGQYTYVVQDVRRPGDLLPPTLAAGAGQLTLVTAEGTGWRSGWAPSNAVYVDARLRGHAVGSPGVSGVRSADDAVLAHETGGMYPMILWLQLLLLAALAGVWIRARWGAPRAWLIGVPVGLAGLWGASTYAWLLLPNLL